MKKTILLILTLIFSLVVQSANSHQKITHPSHLVFMVFDQMRPDYIDRFKLKNFKRLRKMGTNYKNAYVGHMASVTVVSHAVMTTGLLPKDLPWSDNTFIDRTGIIGKPDSTYATLTLSQEQFLKLLTQIPNDQFLIKRFKEKTNKKVFAIGEKNYATTVMGGPFADTIIYAAKKNENCEPFGVNVPTRILEQKRFTIDCTKTYGTENSMYPLDGHHFYPGTDSEHLGGDIWVADLAIDVMKNEKDWGALFLTFGAIDKFGHMLGETDSDSTIHAFQTPAHLKDIAQIADAQLGKILQELERQKILNETLIISTADHGAQTDEIYLGNNNSATNEPFWIQRIAKMAPIRFTTVDTGIRIWLKDSTNENIEKTINVLKEIAQVVEIFKIEQSKTTATYKLEFDRYKTLTPSAQKWAKEHNLSLVNSFLKSSPNSQQNDAAPDIVVGLAEGVGFGKLGDHGGLQEKVQRIPMMVAGPGIKPNTQTGKMRLTDLAPLISDFFDLKPASITNPK